MSARAPRIGVQRLSGLAPPQARAVLEHAVSVGVAWLDAADVYGPASGDAERLVASVAGRLRVATKGGLRREGARWLPDGRARHLEAAAEASRDRLGVERIDLYQLHVPDPRTPVATSARALARVLDRGVAGAIGLCNVTVAQLEQALDEVPVASVQVPLGPLDPSSVRSGIVETCLGSGIPVLAYRPLGGAKGIGKLRRHPVLKRVAQRIGATPEEVALAWLADLGVVPLPGPTRLETVESCVRALDLVLDDEARHALDGAFEAGRQLRVPRSERAPAPDAGGDVVIVMGCPGAGKTSRVADLEGYARLNRDDRGGSLAGLLPELDALLTAGQRHVVLDNTYPSRASRNRVIEVAWAHGVPVRCEWLTTSDDDCEVNVCHRTLDQLGRLPEPAEAFVPPKALSRYRRELEPPALDEGLARIDEVPFARRVEALGTERGLLFDPRDLDRPELAVADGFVLAMVAWQPTADPEGARAELQARAEARGLRVHVALCPHPPGPPVCWCRKPLPGLGVQLVRQLRLDPARSVVLASSPADRALARKLGMRTQPAGSSGLAT